MPDHQADRVLRVIEQNNGKLSGALAKEMQVLEEPGLWEQIVAATKEAFGRVEPVDADAIAPYKPDRKPS